MTVMVDMAMDTSLDKTGYADRPGQDDINIFAISIERACVWCTVLCVGVCANILVCSVACYVQLYLLMLSLSVLLTTSAVNVCNASLVYDYVHIAKTIYYM